jgi:hypothetical protein
VKTIAAFFASLAVLTTGYSQNTFPWPTSGNVGIGTSSPASKLTLVGNATTDPLQLQDSLGHSFRLGPSVGTPGGFQFYDDVAGAVRFRIDNGGKVGIGSAGPIYDLHLWKAVDGPVVAAVRNDSQSALAESALSLNAYGNSWGLTCGSAAKNSNAFDILEDFNDAKLTRLHIAVGGNVGIGTASPSHKLSVNGTVRAREVIVDSTNWSDYVFADDYKLQSLADVEAQIKTNKHLPGVPSAQEVAEKGVSVGDMQALLLSKIEELTLHVIAQEKYQIAQEKRLNDQQTEIAMLKAENARLK